jgi:glycosyltransferase involved in cell wall biosynthesis
VPTALLSASQALTATTATLGGTPHVRFVHEVGVPEHRLLRAAEWLCRRGMTLTVLVCTTDGVQAALAARHPELRSVVRTFTVADPSMYVSPDERVPARAALGIGEDEFVVAMIGGWWPYKDVDMVERALHKVTGPVTLVLVGKPSQPAALEPALQTSGSRSVVLQRPLTEAELRQVYAASDGALVTRVAGFDREASTIYDAARYGVPMIVTDHHPRMTERLAHEPWAHVVPAGDDVTLAAALDELARGDTPRPDPEAPTRLGLFTGEETIGVIADLAAGLPSSSA